MMDIVYLKLRSCTLDLELLISCVLRAWRWRRCDCDYRILD